MGTCRDRCVTSSSVSSATAGRRRAERRTAKTTFAARAVLANVTPPQLYFRLLEERRRRRRGRARRFRYGPAEMQIHMALSEPPQWAGDERLAKTMVIHLTPGLDGVSRAVNEAERGLLPAEATVVCGQPLTLDASRAPEGSGICGSSCRSCPGT